MNRKPCLFFVLSLSSACLLSAGFLFPHCGGFALIGFIPLLWMDRIAGRDNQRHFFWWHYLTFVLWNAFTTFWVCNATVAGGIAAILANAFQMSVIWALFRLFKRRFNGTLPYIFLSCAWIAWEKFYFGAEISWPWLTLGNAFAQSHSCIQWYELTGTIGGSLWIWICNLGIFGLSVALQEGRWSKFNGKARFAAVAALTLAIAGPLVASWIRYATLTEESDGQMKVCLLQPNLDPYQKFQVLSQTEQDEVIAGLIAADRQSIDTSEAVLFVAPEAITNDLVLNRPGDSRTVYSFRKAIAGIPYANMLFGASTYEFYMQEEAPSYTARPAGDGVWYENHNSAVMIDNSPRMEFYHKSRLVIGTEKMPYPRITRGIENALGGNLLGHCIGQDEVSLLNVVKRDSLTSSIPVGCAVCYESIYPEHFASYVAAGARAMTVITNDAWWGDTPGYKQHLSYSRLRAIETRRDIARSANTGISAFINRRGDIVSSTSWWERCSLDGKINLNGHITPFVKYGDVTGRLCTMLFLLLAFALGVNIITRRRVR